MIIHGNLPDGISKLCPEAVSNNLHSLKRIKSMASLRIFHFGLILSTAMELLNFEASKVVIFTRANSVYLFFYKVLKTTTNIIQFNYAIHSGKKTQGHRVSTMNGTWR